MAAVREIEYNAPSRWWVTGAACRRRSDVDFFPGRGQSTAPAKAVCAGCDVQAACLAYALADSDLRGVWGGASERERRRLRGSRTRRD